MYLGRTAFPQWTSYFPTGGSVVASRVIRATHQDDRWRGWVLRSWHCRRSRDEPWMAASSITSRCP